VKRTIAAIITLCIGVLLSSSIVHADEIPPAAFVEGLIGHPQEHNLSCESRSATDLAAFWNETFTEDEFFYRLPKSDNPHKGFLGNVDSPAGSMPPTGYGAYAKPVAANLRSFGLDAQAKLIWSLSALKANLAVGKPAIVWATYDMHLPSVETWTSSDGATSIVTKWQHTFIAVGYDEKGIYLIDAYDSTTKYFPYEAFNSAWNQLGRQAVTVEGSLEPRKERWKMATADDSRLFVVNGRWVVGPE